MHGQKHGNTIVFCSTSKNAMLKKIVLWSYVSGMLVWNEDLSVADHRCPRTFRSSTPVRAVSSTGSVKWALTMCASRSSSSSTRVMCTSRWSEGILHALCVKDVIRSRLKCDFFFMSHRSITPASRVRLGFMAFTCGPSAPGSTLCCSPIDRLYWTSKKRFYIWSPYGAIMAKF